MPAVSRYELVPYASHPVAEAQCRRLEAVSALFHLSPAPPAGARVLELGCGAGDNLAAQALEYPKARFIACDASAAAIAAGRELVGTLALTNIELRQNDFCAVDATWGTFDYILCHGVFSWVGPEVRRRILEVFRDHLADQGIGCVSYNVLPGWHLRRAVRELICRHAGDIEPPHEAIARARDILALAAATHEPGSPFGRLFQWEHSLFSRSSDAYLYHEMLAEHNDAFYFDEFLEQVENAGLQYVGAAEFAEMFTWDLPAKARALVEGMPFLLREQYLDHLRGTAFRSSVLCRAEVTVDRRLDHTMLERFSIGFRNTTRFRKRQEHPEAARSETCAGASLIVGTRVLNCPDPLTAAALEWLDETQPEFSNLPELRQQALQRLGRDPNSPGPDREADACGLARFLRDAVTAGALEATLSPPRVTSHVGERPMVGPLARLQAQRGRAVTNQRQELVELDGVSRFVTGLMDGTRDHHELAELLRRELKAGRVSLIPMEDPDDVDRLVEDVLLQLCHDAMLVPCD